MAKLTPWLDQKFYLADGVTPNAGGKVFTYEAGTSTKKPTYQSESGSANTNPIILNSAGEANIWFESGSYKVVNAPSNDTDPPASAIKTWDDINASGSDESQGIVNTIAELKGLEEGAFTTVQVLGYAAAGDYGTGVFRWDATSTTADNGGTIIAPTVSDGTGRWYRLYTDALNIGWWGATGDGTTDDTTAISNALTFANANDGDLYVPDGNFKLTSGVTVGATTRLIMSKKGYFTASTGVTITFDGELDAGRSLCFSTNITAVFNDGFSGSILPQWWGAVGDGVTDDLDAFNSALAAAANGGRVDIPDAPSDYMISNRINTADNSTIEINWTGSKSYIKLSQPTQLGGMFSTGEGADITFNNPRLDAGSFIGQNGIGTRVGATVRVNGGDLRNFPVANDKTGGKAIASDGWSAKLIVNGTRFYNCHSALSLKRDMATDPTVNAPAQIVVDNVVAEQCDFFAYMAVKDKSVGNFNGTEMSISITNFSLFDCGEDLSVIASGTHGGVFVFDRATNITITNGSIHNQPTYNSSNPIQSVFRGRGRNLCIENVQVNCDAVSVINIDPIPDYAIDESQMANNFYKLNCTGTYDYLYEDDLTLAHNNRDLENTYMEFLIANDVSTSIVTPEARNGTTRIKVTHDGKIATGSDAYFNANFTTMADVPTTHSEDYDAGTWTPVLEGTTGTVGAYAVDGAAGGAQGRWTKIGSMMFINCYLVLSDKGSWTGDVKITGIPANAGGTTGYESHAACLVSNTTLAGDYAVAEISRTSSTYVTIQEITTAAAVVAMPMTAITNTTRIAFSLAYEL